MQQPLCYPLKFQPIYKEKIWGGRRLATQFNRNLPAANIGESWELAAHQQGMSIISNGQWQGRTLTSLIADYWTRIMGTELDQKNGAHFPLLIKLLDAHDKLSVQVHPDDEYVTKYQVADSSKSELWYIIAAQPEAELICGLQPNVNRSELIRGLKENQLADYLQSIPVEAGDSIFIPAGTVHAIKEGILLAEIQQSSDTTFRLYDWNRRDEAGRKRKLHIDQALQAINFDQVSTDKINSLPLSKEGYCQEVLAVCQHFVTEKLTVKEQFKGQPQGKRFEVLLCISGKATIHSQAGPTSIQAGETVLIPAQLSEYLITGEVELLRTYITNPMQYLTRLKAAGYSTQTLQQLGGTAKYL
ncbi:MAG: type I phosphomannose isomerase catalytic subunit [Bacillota bacterium]